MRSIIKAAIRVTIVILFVKYLVETINRVSVLFIYPFSQDLEAYPLLYMYIAFFIVMTVILFLLWWKTDWIVKIVLGVLDENELSINTSNKDLIKVAMYILGLWLLVTSIPDLFGIFAYQIRLMEENPDLIYTAGQQAVTIRDVVSYVITIVIGAWLVLGNKGISKVIDTVMNAPISKVPEE